MIKKGLILVFLIMIVIAISSCDNSPTLEIVVPNEDEVNNVTEDMITKDEFTRLLTRFWEDNKLSNFKDVKLAITNFLTNREGLTKPSFWQIFSSSAAKYNIRSATIETVVDNFIKTGKHTLK